MTAIVGVHGIMNQQLGRHQLLVDWGPALADGLERAAGHQVPIPDLDIVFYGDLFCRPGRAGPQGTGRGTSRTDRGGCRRAPPVRGRGDRSARIRPTAGRDCAKGRTSIPLPLQRICGPWISASAPGRPRCCSSAS